MKLELTEAQAQAVINSQERQIAALRLRLVRAHVTMKYLTGTKQCLTVAQIKAAMNHLMGLIESDSRQGEETGYRDLDHDAIEARHAEYAALLERDNDVRKVPVLGYHYQFVINGHDDVSARNVEGHVKSLMTKYLWVEGEPETPAYFSSPGLSSG